MIKRLLLIFSLLISIQSFSDEPNAQSQLDAEKFKVIAKKIFTAQKLNQELFLLNGTLQVQLLLN